MNTKDLTRTGALDRLAQRIGPHLGSGSIQRSILERAITSLGGDEELRVAAEQALDSARIRVVEDQPRPVSTVPTTEVLARRVEADPPADPRAAGHRRLEFDRLRPAATRHKVILSAEEEVGLTLIARPDGAPLEPGGFALLEGEQREAAEAMLLHNLRLAHSMARSHAGQGLEHDDMYSHALVGLIRAVELFDPAAGYKFSTYATHWLRQAVTRALANESRAVRLPVHMWKLVRKVAATRERLTLDGRPPSMRALAAEMDLPVEKIEETLRLLPGVISLDTPLGDDQFTLGDLVDSQVDRPEHIEVHGLFPEDVDELLLALTEREDGVLRRRFALAPFDEVMTLDDIGKVYGVTRERIRQIEAKALTKVRDSLRRQGHLIDLPTKRGAAAVVIVHELSDHQLQTVEEE